jgi:hypothetical protein
LRAFLLLRAAVRRSPLSNVVRECDGMCTERDCATQLSTDAPRCQHGLGRRTRCMGGIRGRQTSQRPPGEQLYIRARCRTDPNPNFFVGSFHCSMTFTAFLTTVARYSGHPDSKCACCQGGQGTTVIGQRPPHSSERAGPLGLPPPFAEAKPQMEHSNSNTVPISAHRQMVPSVCPNI